MKNLLLLVLVGICPVGWRVDDIVNTFGFVKSATANAHRPVPPLLRKSSTSPARPMSIQELEKLSHSDPNAYRKFLASYQVEEERSSADKLMSFFARGKFE